MPIEEWISLSNIFIYKGTGSERIDLVGKDLRVGGDVVINVIERLCDDL